MGPKKKAKSSSKGEAFEDEEWHELQRESNPHWNRKKEVYLIHTRDARCGGCCTYTERIRVLCAMLRARLTVGRRLNDMVYNGKFAYCPQN
jgi:hypothetical protein